MTYDRELLAAELRRDEGVRPLLYDDATGKPIFKGSVVVGNPTVGVGRNMLRPLSDAAIDFLLAEDMRDTEADLDLRWPWWRYLDPVRQLVMCNMCLNMGGPRLAGFVRFLAAVRAGSYEVAAHEMASSLWARQVGERAVRLEGMMIRGADDVPGSPPTV